MKKLTAMVIMWAMLYNAAFASFAFADPVQDVKVDVKNGNTITNSATGGNADQWQKMKQKQEQDQNQQNVSTITTPGNMPVASTHGLSLPSNQTGDYGKLITQSSLEGSALLFCGMTNEEFQTMISIIDKKSEDEWEKTNGKIYSHPFVRHDYSSKGVSEKVYFPKLSMSLWILKRIEPSMIVGGWYYDSKFNKDNAVLMQHLQMRARSDAASLGANVVISIDEFNQKYFVPESFEFSASGVLSWISRMFTSGSSVAGSAGIAVAQNASFIRPGAAFIFLRIEGITDEACGEPPSIEKSAPPASPTVECPKPKVCNPDQFLRQIEIWKEACRHCKKPCFNNEKLRKCMADTYADLYHCTGEKKYLELAIREYDQALKDFTKGHEPDGTRTRSMKGAQIIASMVNYNKSWCTRELQGRDAQYAFAAKHGINPVPSSYEDLRR